MLTRVRRSSVASGLPALPSGGAAYTLALSGVTQPNGSGVLSSSSMPCHSAPPPIIAVCAAGVTLPSTLIQYFSPSQT